MKKTILIVTIVALSSIAFNFEKTNSVYAAQICTGTAARSSAKVAEFINLINNNTEQDPEIGAKLAELGAQNLNKSCSDEEVDMLFNEAKRIADEIVNRRETEEKQRQEEAASQKAEEEARAKEESEKQQLLNEKNQKSENNKATEIVEIQTPNTGFKQDKNNLVLIFSASITILSVIATTKKLSK